MNVPWLFPRGAQGVRFAARSLQWALQNARLSMAEKTHLILQLVFCPDLQRETMIFTYYIPCLFWRQMLKTEPNTPIYTGYLKHFSNTRSKGTENNGVLFDSGSFGRNFFRLSHVCQKKHTFLAQCFLRLMSCQNMVSNAEPVPKFWRKIRRKL